MVSGLVSCESLVTNIPASKLPKGTEKIVLHAYISPQDTIVLVKVTKSNPVFGTFSNNGFGFSVIGKDTVFYTGGAIENAKVTLSNSKKQSAQLAYDKREGVYLITTKNFPIVAGETYTLTAEAAQGKAEASCTVPMDVVKIKSYSIDTVTIKQFEYVRTEAHILFEWDDVKGMTNYYTMKASVQTELLIPESKGGGQVVYVQRKPIYDANWDDANGHEEYQSDVNTDGTSFMTPKGVIYLNSGIYNINGKQYFSQLVGRGFVATLELLNVDKNYYSYHRSVRTNSRQDNNPFVEPVPLYSNVTGGLGCFAASNKFILKVDF